MELRRDLLLPVIILVSLAVLTSFGAIGLLARMSPAIERILAENVYSLEAIEEMLALSTAPGPLDDGQRERFSAALERAAENITETAERDPVSAIERDWPAAAGGDDAARARLVGSLRTLSAVNREAMFSADDRAKTLGNAGAWTAVFLGALAFLLGLLAVRRARVRVLAPLEELADVVKAYRRGDTMRRCAPLAAPREVEAIMKALDDLLDRTSQRRRRTEPPARDDRSVVVHLLDRIDGPAFVVSADGTVDAANRAGLERLSDDDGAALRDRLRAAASAGGGDDTEGAPDIAVETIGDDGRVLCTL